MFQDVHGYLYHCSLCNGWALFCQVALLFLQDSVHFLLMLAARLPLAMLGGGIVYCDNSILYVKSDNEDFVDMALHWFSWVFSMPWSGARPSWLNLVLETKADFSQVIFCNGRNREGKKKEGWFICWGLLHFTSERKISVSRDSGAFISRWELGGRSRCLSHWQALRKPVSTSERKAQQAFLRSTNCCQLSKWNGSAVSLPGCLLAKIQSDY